MSLRQIGQHRLMKGWSSDEEYELTAIGGQDKRIRRGLAFLRFLKNYLCMNHTTPLIVGFMHK